MLGILAQCPANLLDPLISIYQLHAADRNHLLEHVSHLYHKGDYKEVGRVFPSSVPTQRSGSVNSCVLSWVRFNGDSGPWQQLPAVNGAA